MPALPEQISMLEAAVAAQEALRPTLGDAAVDAAIAALQAQLRSLRDHAADRHPASEPHPASERPAPPGSDTDKSLALLRGFMPREVADKMLATGRIEGERKQVTVVFADLSGFTALSETLDPEELTSLTTQALQALAGAVYQYEGYIDKFIGDAVMAVFGVPLVHEDDPERALRSALAMREALARFNERHAGRLGQPLAMHIGVNTGTVIAGNVGSDLRMSYTVMGDTVNTASRLESAAEAGQIFVSPDTWRLTNEAFMFTRHEPIALKGKREPLAVFELQRARLLPGKSRGLQGLASAFVGRDEEMGRLRAVVDELEAGRGRIVVVQGEAGLGKSRLMSEWRAAIGDRARWVEGRCFANTTSLSFGPFLDLIRRYAGIQGDQTDTEARAQLSHAVEQYLPGEQGAPAIMANLLAFRLSEEESRVLASIPAQSLRLRVFELVETLFARLADERPTVLLIEDLHWADETSLELLEHLLALTARLAFALVLVQRPPEEGARPRLLASIDALQAERRVEVLLTPLSSDSSAAMVQQLLSTRALPQRLRSTILAKAEGNPFFVEEVIRSLIDRGALVREGSSWTATPVIESVAVPDTLQGVLMARLDRLPADTKWLAQQASVIGRIFLYRVLLRLAETGAAIDTDLGALQREDLVRERARDPEIEYMFRHALTQETAYQSLLAPRRKELHRKAGEAMEALFSDRLAEYASIIGEHFLRGEEWDKAADFLTRAGDAAAKLYAFSEARLHYDRARESLSHSSDEVHQRRRVEAAVRLASVTWMAVDPSVNLAHLAEAEQIAMRLDGGLAEKVLLARVRYWKGRVHSVKREVNEAIRYYQQVLQVGREVGDEELIAIPASMTARAVFFLGRFDQASDLFLQAISPLERAGNWTEAVYSRGCLGAALAMRGYYRDGLEQGTTALEQAREKRMPIGIIASHTWLAAVQIEGGRLREGLESARAATESAEQNDQKVYAFTGYACMGWCETRLGLHQPALEHLARSREIAGTLGGRLIASNFFAAYEAEAMFNAGMISEAAEAAGRTSADSAVMGDTFGQGLAERIRAQSAAILRPDLHEEIDSHFKACTDLFMSGDARVETARAHVCWGSVCGHRGDPEAAREHYEKAAAQFRASELPHELQKVTRLIHGLG